MQNQEQEVKLSFAEKVELAFERIEESLSPREILENYILN